MEFYWDGVDRILRCEDRCSVERIYIERDRQLSIGELTRVMMRKVLFNGSEESRKDQLTYRRLAGGLSKSLDSLGAYFSTEELAAIQKASNLLGRLGDAAERAKKEKKRAEEAEKLRVAGREREALKALRARYVTDSLADNMVAACIIERIENASWPKVSKESIFRDLERVAIRNPSPATSFKNSFERDFSEVLQEVAGKIGYRKSPVDELLQQAFTKIDEVLSAERGSYDNFKGEVSVKMRRTSFD